MQRFAEIIAREDRCTTRVGAFGKRKRRGEAIVSQLLSVSAVLVLFRRSGSLNGGKEVVKLKGNIGGGKDDDEEVGFKAEWASAVLEVEEGG